MSQQKVKKFKSKHKIVLSKSTSAEAVSQIDIQALAKRERYSESFLTLLLLAFGIYQSVLFFGHKVVPISDFPDIIRIGHEILSLKIPYTFKQAPVVCVLQAALSHLLAITPALSGQNPDLTAGWLLNAILHPFNVVLFYLVGKKIIGKAAFWFAIIAIINHWVIYMLTEPLMETPLLFFSLLTFYFIFRRSKLSYLFASITTMVRYEGAALILAAFVMDMINSTDRPRRIRAFLYSLLATVPLLLWLLGTFLTWKPGTTHYLEVLFKKEYTEAFAQPVKDRIGILLHLQLLWLVGFRPLLTPHPDTGQDLVKMLVIFSKTVALLGFCFGSIYGLCKRRWEILALLLFFVPYFLLHARYPYPLTRYHSTIFWIALLLCWFGLQTVWKLIDKNNRVPKVLVLILQALVATITIIWLIPLLFYLPRLSSISPKSVSLPYVAMTLVAIIFAARLYIYKPGCFLRELAILAFVFLVIASNQFTLAALAGDGKQDEEFKLLANWFMANAKPDEKMGVYMARVVGIFAPKAAERIVPLPAADSPQDFIKTCYQQNITYVVWATREGMRDDHTGYRRFKLHENIAQLATPKNTGTYQFITQVGSERGYVNIFRLRPPKPEPDIK